MASYFQSTNWYFKTNYFFGIALWQNGNSAMLPIDIIVENYLMFGGGSCFFFNVWLKTAKNSQLDGDKNSSPKKLASLKLFVIFLYRIKSFMREKLKKLALLGFQSSKKASKSRECYL